MQSIVSLFTTYLPYFVLVLTLLVFVHEYGHYWVGAALRHSCRGLFDRLRA